MKFLTLAAAVGAACATWVSAAAAATPPTRLPGPAFPSFHSSAEVNTACDKGLADAKHRAAALERLHGGKGWLRAYDELTAFTEDAANPIDFIVNVHPEKAVRDAAQACTLRWADFQSTLAQSEKLYKAAKATKPADAIDAEFLRVILEGFEDSGVSLAPEKRARAKQINDKLVELGQQFSRNLRDDHTQVPFTEEELRGVPENVWKSKPRDAQGRVLLGLSYPEYYPVEESAISGAARERMYRAKMNEGGDENLKLLGEMAQLRREYARLFGFDSYDDFTLRRRMAGSKAKVDAFLNDVKAVVGEAELRDLDQMRQLKAAELKEPLDQTRVQRWDVPYYTELGRKEKFSVDQDAFRPYFPPEQSLQFALRVIEKMMGVHYTPVPATLWQQDVRAFAVSDAATGKPLATLYVDLYPREGKYNHAAVWSFRNGSMLEHRVPQAALVVNLDRKGLSLEELETLLHELGHSVHDNLSATRYTSQAGTNVLRDFVEAPSQMLEDWVYDDKVLKVFGEVCPDCKQVPAEMLAQARAARDYAKGVRFARQHLYASYDIALHGPDAPEPMGLWEKMEGATPLGYIPGTKFPAGFGHLASGYAAGYYGYLWSLVVAMDLRTAFAADKLDPKVGMRYRNIVLANGAQRPPQELVKEFLGRETNSKAFFDYLRK
jgi:thimet oligopeptidase